MEGIELRYYFNDETDNLSHEVRTAKHKESITANEVCEMFMEFMLSVGYSEEIICNYFNKE